MGRILLALLSLAATAFAQYTLEKAGPPPAELAPEMAAALRQEGHKVLDAAGNVHAELWFRNASVDGADSGEMEVSWSTVAHGTFVGAIRYAGPGTDRRGQQIEPGVYTLRFSFYPVDGAHQGVEPSRDFLILSPAATDKDPAATPSFDELMDMSRKASGTPHPAGLSMWKEDSSSWKPGLEQLGEDWLLNVKVGDAQLSVIVVGVNAHG